MKQIFTNIYHDNFWQSTESVSGPGSTLDATKNIRETIPLLIKSFNIGSILDIPCGDFQWFREMKGLEGIRYIGGDIVEPLITQNRERYPGVEFHVMDITKDRLPYADIILVRDLFVHFSDGDIKKSLQNIRSAGIKFLLTTTFPDINKEVRIETGQWRPVNMGMMHGFSQEEIVLLPDPAGFPFENKSLGLWKMEDYLR